MFNIIGIKFSVSEFEKYCKTINKQSWVSKIILHNTAIPSIAQRPGGILTKQHINNLHRYYSEDMNWNGGPHLFVDVEGIWVFNPLSARGTHSPSYNKNAWGVEMLGNFDKEPFNSGLGNKIRVNAENAVAILAEMQGWSDVNDRLLLHKEDKATTHDCPGKNVKKGDFITNVNLLILGSGQKPKTFSADFEGIKLEGAFSADGKSFVPIRQLCELAGLKVDFDIDKNHAHIHK